MRGRIAFLWAGLIVLGRPLATTRADEPIVLGKVPMAARHFAAQVAPGVKFTKATIDRANHHFKLRGKDARGRDVRILCDETAEFVQVAVSAPIAPKDVPKAVFATRDRTMRGAGRFRFEATQVLRVEQTVAGAGAKTVLFEFVGKGEQGAPMRQVIREDGVNIGLGDAAD